MPPLPSLAHDFPTPDPEAWRALVEKGLKGAAFETRLVTRTDPESRASLATVTTMATSRPGE